MMYNLEMLKTGGRYRGVVEMVGYSTGHSQQRVLKTKLPSKKKLFFFFSLTQLL